MFLFVLYFQTEKNAYGLERAKAAGIETAYLNLVQYSKRYPDPDPSVKYSLAAREAYDADLARRLLDAKPDLVVCAGWMHILSTSFLQPLESANVSIINLHPALPGEYDGARAIERAYEDFQKGSTKRTGVMIHYVVQEVDRGAPIVTREVEIKTGDSLEDLEERIHACEHELIVQGTNIALRNISIKLKADGAP